MRRLLAGFACCAVVVSGLVSASSGAAALPLESDPPITAPAEPEAGIADAADGQATNPAGGGAGSSAGDDATPSADAKASDEDAMPSTGGDPVSTGDEEKQAAGDEPQQSDGDGVKPSGGGSGSSSPVARAGVTPAAGLVSIAATVVEDGNAVSVPNVAPISFASHGPVLGINGRVLDDSPNNGVVAVNDSVIYRITAKQSSTPGTQTLVAVLPQGMAWDPGAGASNPSRCDVSASASTGTLRCSWSNVGVAQDYTILARAWVGLREGAGITYGRLREIHPVNGAVVAPVFYDSSTSGASFPGPELTVVGEPRIPLAFSDLYNGIQQNVLFEGELGLTYALVIRQAVAREVSNEDVRGLEAPARPFDYVLDVPDGAVLYSAYDDDNSDISVSQPAGAGGDVSVTVMGPSLNIFYGPGIAYASWGLQRVTLFVPYDPFIPEGGYTYLPNRVSGFDPQSVSQVSNYGEGVAPGQDDTSACPTDRTAQDGRRCATIRVQRPVVVPAELKPTSVQVRAPNYTSSLLGDAVSTSRGTEKLVPGQAFVTTVGVFNADNADGSVLGAFGCVSWDAAQLALTGEASAVTTPSSGESSFSSTVGTALASERYQVEYATRPGGADPKTFDCGVAGSGDTAGVSWSSSWSAAADAVRVRWLDDVAPGLALGLRLPMARTATAFPTNTPLPWFWQYGWNADPSTTVLSNYNPGTAAANQTTVSARGGTVQAVSAMVYLNPNIRSWSGLSAGNGDVMKFTVSPFVIGPVAGPDTVATDTKVTVTFSACVSPIAASLPSNATLTPADYGADGIPCTADDGAAATIVFDLGDVPAVTGPAGSDRGHQVALPNISFQVLVAPGAPEESRITGSMRISSTADTPRASGTDYGRGTSDSATVAAAEVLRGSKTALTRVDGRVAPGEDFSYTVAFSNTLRGSFLPAVFVDVLPFRGDARLQSGEGDALSGGGEPFAVTGVSASMLVPYMGGIDVFYSTADPAVAYATLAGAPDGSDPVFGWRPWPVSGVPAGVTALKFVTTDNLDFGDAGTATVSLRAGALGIGVVHNDVFGVVADDPSSEPELASHTFYGSIRQMLRSSVGSLAGTVQRDADFDGVTSDTVDATNDAWWPAGGVVELVQDGVVKHTATIGADGVFDAGLVDAGSYVVRVRDASGWTTLAGGSVTVAAGGVVAGHRVVVQESVADPVLLDDLARVNMGGTVTVDVTANDSLPSPTVSVASPARIVLSGSGTTSRGGTFVVSSTPGVVYAGQPQVSYTASGVWPAGVSGSSYTDTFTYSWTNVLGVTGSATVTVTVVKAPTATGGTATIPVGGSHTFDADPQGSIVSASVTTAPSQGAASVDASTGMVTFDGTGADPGTYTFTVTWTDDEAQTGTSSYTVIVQAPPTASGGTATIGVDGSHTFDADPQTTGSIASASVTTTPSQGAASVDAATGEVTFDATGADPGTYTFTVTWTDDLGQTGTSEYTVTVQDAPVVTGGTSAVIPVDGSHTFDLEVSGATVTSASVTDSPSCDIGDGVGSVTSDTSGRVVFDGTGVAAGAVCTFEVTFTDVHGQSTPVTFTVTVQAPPTATGGTATIGVDGSHTFDADPQTTGSIASASVTTSPSQGSASVDAATGEVTFDATGADPGTYSFTVTWTDDLGQTGTSEYTVIVQAGPSATGGTATIPVDGSHTFDADPQTTGSIASASVTTVPSQGAASVDAATGEVTFDATGADPGTYSFTVTWTDDLGQTGTSEYTVVVQAGPSASGGTATIPVGGSHVFDADPQGVVVSASVTTAPSQGSASVDASTGEVSFDGSGVDPGSYSFTVTWVDDQGQTGTSTYTVTVQAPPTASGGTATIGVDGSHSFDAAPQTTGRIASASVTTAPSQGAASVDAATGEETFDATGADPGTYEFTVTWVDDLGQTGTSSYMVTVEDAPVVTGGTSAVIPVDGSHTFDLTVSGGTVTSASVTGGPSCDTGEGVGSVTTDTSGRVVFDGTGVAAGAVCTFEVTFTDVHGQSTVVEFTVTVQPPPTASGGEATIPVDGRAGFNGAPQTRGRIAAAVVSSVPSQGVVSVDGSTGEVGFDALGAAPGTYSFAVTWTDDLGQTGVSEYMVTVRDLVVVGQTESRIPVGGRHAHHPEVNHPDHVVSVEVVGQPARGRVSVDPATGEVSYEAGDATPGVYTYRITWTDDLGQTATLTHTVTVYDTTTPTSPPATATPTPTTPEPSPPITVHMTDTPTPSPSTTSPVVVGTGGTVSGGPASGGVAGLVVSGLVFLLAAGFALARRRDVGR